MQDLGTFAALDEYLAYLWHRTAGIDPTTKAETQANVRNIPPKQSYQAEMQVGFLFLNGKFVRGILWYYSIDSKNC
jgi:hypothetical protein